MSWSPSENGSVMFLQQLLNVGALDGERAGFSITARTGTGLVDPPNRDYAKFVVALSADFDIGAPSFGMIEAKLPGGKLVINLDLRLAHATLLSESGVVP